MNRSIWIFVVVNYLLFPAFTQSHSVLDVRSFSLENGLTVMLNEDRTASNVFGAVVVKAGGVHESPDATGMAHYLEHLLFKGTEILGTTDYTKEQLHLQAIKRLYDQLESTKSESERKQIQKKINEESVKASEYGLPNEFSKLLKSIGASDINAYTGYDETAYHNYFPSHEIERWLDLYSNRFQNPVFRGFQSELEVVYEEKNLRMEDYTVVIFNEMEKLLIPNLPYGQWTLIGHTDHLKNPSISKMQQYYDRNYLADNMALILTGNFDTKAVIPLIKDKFNKIKLGYEPHSPLPSIQRIRGVHNTEIVGAPQNMRLLGFQTVNITHKDRVKVDVLEYLLSNPEKTGYLDKITRNYSLVAAGGESTAYNAAGTYIAYYTTPKDKRIKSELKAEIDQVFEKLRTGNFQESMLHTAKLNLIKNFQKKLESLEDRGNSMVEAYSAGTSWDEFLKFPQKVESVTVEDIMAVAKQHFSGNYVDMMAKKGNLQREKLKKPEYKPTTTRQNGVSSYALKFNKMTPQNVPPNHIDLKNSVERLELPGGHKVYRVENLINDLFRIKIIFPVGTSHDPLLLDAVNFMNHSGGGDYPINDFKNQFARIGCSYQIQADINHLVLSLEGMEKNFEPCMRLIGQLLHSPNYDESTKSLLISEYRKDRTLESADPGSIGFSLARFAFIGTNSEYVSRTEIDKLEAMSSDDFVKKFKEIIANHTADVQFTGRITTEDLGSILSTYLPQSQNTRSQALTYYEGRNVDENTIYLIDDGKARQSHIFLFVKGDEMEISEYPLSDAFGTYFGSTFTGVIWQEIREYRSLAYVVNGQYITPLIPEKPGKFIAGVGCQSDKTIETLEVLTHLVQDMPVYTDRITDLKAGLINKLDTDVPQQLELARFVYDLEERGHIIDPAINARKVYQSLSMEDIINFHKRHIKGRPYILSIYGNKKHMDIARLNKLGKVIEVNKEDIFTN